MVDAKPYWQDSIDGAWADGNPGRIDVTIPAKSGQMPEHAGAIMIANGTVYGREKSRDAFWNHAQTKYIAIWLKGH